MQDGRSEHERQYLFCQSVDASEDSELVKTPKWVRKLTAKHFWFFF